jgi:hypothetical protein
LSLPHGNKYKRRFIFIKNNMAKTTKSKPVKYADKSAGQPELVTLFSKIKKIISAYAGANYTVKADKPGHYELYYGKEVEIAGRQYPELCFAGLLIQKAYVGFYFFPVYIDATLKSKLNAELLKTLKGKTCFHIKKQDDFLLKAIKEALQCGYAYYSSKGWN